jgi:tRNA nucleotidyltransferase/poly(A) polymerase
MALDSRQLRFFSGAEKAAAQSFSCFNPEWIMVAGPPVVLAQHDDDDHHHHHQQQQQQQHYVVMKDLVEDTKAAIVSTTATTTQHSSINSKSFFLSTKFSAANNNNNSYNGDGGSTVSGSSSGSNSNSFGSSSSSSSSNNNSNNNNNNSYPSKTPTPLTGVTPKRGYGPYITLSEEERELFRLLRRAREEMDVSATLRVAGGWVRDKLLATPEFTRLSPAGGRLTSKYKKSASSATSSGSTNGTCSINERPGGGPSVSMGRQGSKVIGDTNSNNNNKNSGGSNNGYTTTECQPPVDIDIALDTCVGREFAEQLNSYLSQMGEKTHTVGVVLKNPEKSKHLETATMKVGTFWIDFVNLRAEEYTQDSRIPDLMRIGTPAEDAFRRDLTINSLFYNVNNGQVEDWTGRGFDDLRRGVVSTPLAPLTTLLDDPLRALRSVRFAARLRFTMDEPLIEAAMDTRVRKALAEKVSRERIGCEVDLMLRSPDPVGAMRLLINLNLARTVFPMEELFSEMNSVVVGDLFRKGLDLLSTNHEQLEENKVSPPMWCSKAGKATYMTHGTEELSLCEDDDARRYLWYASFLKPLYDYSNTVPEDKRSKRDGRKANRSVVCKLLVDELKRPHREAEAVEKIMKGANDFKRLMDSGCDFTAGCVLLSDIRVDEANVDRTGMVDDVDNDTNQALQNKKVKCTMKGEEVNSATELDPVWQHAMEFRLLCSKVIRKVGPLWRAALFLAMSEDLSETLEGDLEYVIEGDIVDESQEDLRQMQIDRYDGFATAMQRVGLIGIWAEKPILDGDEVKQILPRIPKGPTFRDVMEEQESWMALHPGGGVEYLVQHLSETFPNYVGDTDHD